MKGRVLFGLDLAREGIRQKGHAVLMEGQFDVIVGHRFGVTNAIAASGTALTEEQVRLLKRFTEEVVVVFDSDPPGRAAAFRAVEQASAGGLRIRVGLIEGPQKDPDEFLRAGGDWEAVLRSARPGWEFWIRDSIADLKTSSPDQLELALRRVDEILAKIADPAVREQYRRLVPQWIDADPATLLRRLRPARPSAQNGAPRPGSPASATFPPARATTRMSVALRYLLEVLAVRPEAVSRVASRLAPDDLEDGERGTFTRMMETLSRGGLSALEESLPDFPEEEQDLVRRAWAHPPHSVDDATLDEVLSRIRAKAIERRKRAAIAELRDAEARGDREAIDAIQARLVELRREAQGR